MKENVDEEVYVEEVENEGARSDRSGRKIRYIAEHKRNILRVTTVPPVDFFRDKNKEQVQEAGEER